MCWVIPPDSPSTTLVFLILSNRVVFPWSTCPKMVTIGGRVASCLGSSSLLSITMELVSVPDSDNEAA